MRKIREFFDYLAYIVCMSDVTIPVLIGSVFAGVVVTYLIMSR